MVFDDELKFEKTLVKVLQEQCGWEKEVIKNPLKER